MMSLFIVFILGAVLLGAGAMLSPAWHTAQPRVGLCATLCLALVMGGAVFYAEAFAWDTLVVDYLLFALLSGVVLGGTLSTAQARAEARGEQLADRDQGWPGPEDLAFFALVAILLLIPLVNLPAPLGSQGQVLGLHSLTTREGESFNALAPFLPGGRAIVSPGFHALSAYLSQQLAQSIPLIQMSLAAVVLFLCIWLAYDFGAELRDKSFGRALAVALLLCGGWQRSYLAGHFSELLGLLFTVAFLLYALRLLRRFNLADLIAGGLMMGAVIYSNLSISLVLALAFIALCALVWLDRRGATSASSRWAVTLGLPLVALIGIAPWLWDNLPLILPISPSPYPPDIGNLAGMTSDQGIIILPLALWGIVIGLRQAGSMRRLSLLMLVWLLLVSDFALFGLIPRLLPPLADLSNAPNLARHGVILPFSFFGGLALLHLWETVLSARVKRILRRGAYPLLGLAGAGLILMGVTFSSWWGLAGTLLDLPPSSLTRDDIAAMTWLRDNSAEDALLLAVDGDGWLPVFAERRTVDFRAVSYFEWSPLERSAADEDAVDYIFVSAGREPPADRELELVFEQGGARVYQVVRGD